MKEFRMSEDRLLPARSVAPPIAVYHPVAFVTLGLFHRWRPIAAVTLLFALAALALVLSQTSSTARATLLVKSDRQLPPQVLRSEASHIKSRDVLRRVAERQPAAGSDAGADLEQRVNQLVGRTVTQPIRDTNIVQVVHEAESPDQAVGTLRTIVDEYLKSWARANNDNPRLLAVYDDAYQRTADELRASEEELNRWRRAHGAVSIDAAITAQLPVVAERERMLRHTEAELESTRAQIAAVERELAGQPERIATSQEVVRNPVIATLKAEVASAEARLSALPPSPEATKLRNDLATEEAALEDLRRRYTDKHRRVQEKQEHVAYLRRAVSDADGRTRRAEEERLARLRKELAAAEADGQVVGSRTTSLNPLREELSKQLAAARARHAALLSTKAELERQVQDTSKSMATLRGSKLQEERLARKVAIAGDSLQLYARKRAETRIAADAEATPSRIAVLEAPFVEGDAGMGKRFGLVVLAAALGLALSSVIVLGMESFNSTLRVPEDVALHLGLPVLAAIPERVSDARPARRHGGRAWRAASPDEQES
jgi:uncharacterized protein involved in exopolysaccharide biosynthesis